MDKHDVALIGVLLSLFLGMISFFNSGSIFFNEFLINVVFSILVMITVFAYANKKHFFNYMVLIYSSLSLMNIIYLYIYSPVWIIVPNFVICTVLFIKHSFFLENGRKIVHHDSDAVLADTVSGYSDIEPKISVDIISENPNNVNPKERKMLKRFLEKIKKGFKVIRFPKKQKDYPMRSSDEGSYVPDSYVPSHSNPRSFDVSMDKTPKNGYFELKVSDSEEEKPKKKAKDFDANTEEMIDKIFEKASVEPLPEITYDSKKKKVSVKPKAKKKSK